MKKLFLLLLLLSSQLLSVNQEEIGPLEDTINQLYKLVCPEYIVIQSGNDSLRYSKKKDIIPNDIVSFIESIDGYREFTRKNNSFKFNLSNETLDFYERMALAQLCELRACNALEKIRQFKHLPWFDNHVNNIAQVKIESLKHLGKDSPSYNQAVKFLEILQNIKDNQK